MKYIEVGIVYRFWSEDDSHAVEQFINALDLDGDAPEAQHIRDNINVIFDVQEQ